MSISNLVNSLRYLINPLETPAMLLGWTGAALMIPPSNSAKIAGLGCWVIGNALWTSSGITKRNMNIVGQNSVFLVLAIVGIFTNSG